MPRIFVEDKDADNNAKDGSKKDRQSWFRPVVQFISKNRLLALLSFIIIILLFTVGYLVNDQRRLNTRIKELNAAKSASPEDEALVLKQEVGSVIQLPDNEIPTVATVVDVSKVNSQPFFANAQNGDKVLLFVKNSKAILYRPAQKKIIEISPIDLGQNASASDTQNSSIKVSN